MKRALTMLAFALIVFAAILSVKLRQLPAASENTATWQVFFSPHGGCTQAIVNCLDGAKKKVLVQTDSFTSAPIARALVAAKQRGVMVQAMLDKSQRSEKYSLAAFLVHPGIPTYIDAAYALAHNKVMVIDDETVITGSFTFTTAAEKDNAENLLILKSAALASKYTANWNVHQQHSEVYRENASAQPSSTPPTSINAASFIGDKSTMLFHRAICTIKTAPEDRVIFSTRQEAIDAGYRPCDICNP